MDGLMDREGVLDSYEVASALRYSGRWKSAQVREKQLCVCLGETTPTPLLTSARYPSSTKGWGGFCGCFGVNIHEKVPSPRALQPVFSIYSRKFESFEWGLPPICVQSSAIKV